MRVSSSSQVGHFLLDTHKKEDHSNNLQTGIFGSLPALDGRIYE